MAAPRFRLNAPTVASQVIDGEAILINFESGAYYSAGRAGAALIELLESRVTVAELAAHVVVTHDGDREQIEAAVCSFLAELEAEALIVPCADSEPPSSLPEPGAKKPFEAPSLQKFDDLQDILLLDPIHDGDQPAWPVEQADTPLADD